MRRLSCAHVQQGITVLGAIKRTVATGLEKLGYTVVPHWRLDRLPSTRYLKRLLGMLKTDCVLDVGANAGQYHDFLRSEVGFDGTIISFEPTPELVEQMRARSKSDPKWIIQSVALGSNSGVARFNAMQGSEFNSFLPPNHSRIELFRTQNVVARTIEVEVRTLDCLLPELLQGLNVNSLYLKLDTQGFDLEVVKGASQSLPKIRGLQTEASVVPIYDNSPDYVTTIRTVEEKDFVLSGIYPNNEGHFPRLVEFDCYFVAKSHSLS